jgi:hypothetical protein
MPKHWLNLVDAAAVLGTTPEAVRMRAKRGSLESEKRDDGRLYVRVVTDQTEGEQHLHDRESQESALIEQLRSEVEYLRDENRRKDSIIMQMAQRIPELEPAPEHPQQQEASQPAQEPPQQPPEPEPRQGIPTLDLEFRVAGFTKPKAPRRTNSVCYLARRCS